MKESLKLKCLLIILDATVKVGGGVKYVNHGLVISLLWDVIALIEGLLHDLKLIVKAEIILGCTFKELSVIVAELLIVCVFFFLVMFFAEYDFT